MAKSVKPSPMKKSAPAKRGKCLTLPQIQLVHAVYKKAEQDNPHLSVIGVGKLALPSEIKATSAKKVLAMLKEGKSPEDIYAGMQSSRQWSSGKKMNQENAKKVKKMLKSDNSTATNSQRLMAAKLGCSQFTVNRIVKKIGLRPLKHVKTTHNSETKKAKRERIAREIVSMYADGMRTKRVFCADETWVDENTCARYNPQNDRKYYHKSVSKDSVIEELRKPIKQRTPGIMVHITVSSAQGGLLLKPHFVPSGTTMTAAYYCAMSSRKSPPRCPKEMHSGGNKTSPAPTQRQKRSSSLKTTAWCAYRGCQVAQTSRRSTCT